MISFNTETIPIAIGTAQVDLYRLTPTYGNQERS
jgi:hypothetical protein